VHEPLSGGFDERDLGQLVAACGPGSSLLLVGHEPDLSGVVAALSAARIEMKKGGIAAVRGGRLVALLRPREIELVAGL
jgi:phosphohistidine phosphatase SixA